MDYNAEYITDEEDGPQHTATRATGIAKPKQPTAQERAEHELTHLPYRTWCDICVRTKGKANSHPRQKIKQPVIQVDIAYIKSLDDKTSVPILTAIDVETGMSMATLIQDKTQHFEYLVNCMCNFLIECGRAQAILPAEARKGTPCAAGGSRHALYKCATPGERARPTWST